MNEISFKIIAHIKSDFDEKFGIPRQSGILEGLKSTIQFEPEFRNPDTLRGLEGFSHLWILWIFSENIRDTWKPTVRPPRLGGNRRLGVFATRSSFRPNPVALSCVKIEEIKTDGPNGPEIIVSGADLMNGTPIVDIKPYLPYADSVPQALGGFATAVEYQKLQVECDPSLLKKIPSEKRDSLLKILEQDPRPHYQSDASRVYGLNFAQHNIRFTVNGDILKVQDIE